MQQAAIAHVRQHLDDLLGGNTAILLCDFPARLEREARPGSNDLALFVREHAVVVARAVHQLNGFQVRFAELECTRQREGHRIDRSHGRLTRLHLAVATHANGPDLLAWMHVADFERRGLRRRVTDQLRVVRDDREVVQGMHILDATGNLDRAGEGQTHIANDDGYRVAIDHDQTALGIGDHARAVIVALGDARHRIGHVEVHQHERRRNAIDDRIGALDEARGRRFRRISLAVLSPRRTRPHAARVIALAGARREPATVHADHSPLRGRWIVHGREPQRHSLAILERSHRCLELSEIGNRFAADLADHGTARNGRSTEHITGIGDIHALHRPVQMTCLLP